MSKSKTKKPAKKPNPHPGLNQFKPQHAFNKFRATSFRAPVSRAGRRGDR